jgi:alkanesulfonate monooxygenase SsuD/methylene tetrahydromethanopterin reductase-like flavin-dependent oxidoreductase (luciferase family)
MAPPLRFGILIEQRHAWQEMVDRVHRYEALGFDTVWIADCFADPYKSDGPWLDAWTLLAGLAARTTRIRLGTLISHVVYRSPAVLARQAVTVDQIANGRLELGLGSGATEQDWPMTSGRPPWSLDERVERLGETLEIMNRLFIDRVCTFAGRHYQVEGATLYPGSVRQPRPRLTVAAHGPKGVALAARHADVWNTAGIYWKFDRETTTPATALDYTRSLNQLLDQEATAAGRDPAKIERSILVGQETPVQTARPWASVDAFQDFVGTYREIGFTEFISPEPASPTEETVLANVAGELLPGIRLT